MSTIKVYKSEKAALAVQESYNALLKLWRTDVQELDLEGRYGTPHLLVFGNQNASPLILFHGVGDDSALMWVYNAKELAACFHCFAVDTIGGPGKSVPAAGYDSSFDDVLWIDEILDALKLDRVYMAGVSNGAYLTQLYMAKRPERAVRGISLAGIPVPSSGNSKAKAMKAMMKVFLPEALFPTDRNIKKLIGKMTGSNGRVFTDNPTVFTHFKQLMTGFNRTAMMNHRVIGLSEADILSLKDRLLCIVGREDPFMVLGADALREQIKRLQLKVVWFDDAGHGINHEKAREVNRLMTDFLL